ncbi:calcium-binding mitochondrial carrier protein SCaMC-2-like [Clytia hemisphaerica]|uniref:calcium-binding mitochondrial carrier protein SCaMC-2-like n=1 Tax=Clytia hemisphaerica TaxID=252671 RepID=UPI0034D438C3
MSWYEGIYDKCKYVQQEFKRCFGYWSDQVNGNNEAADHQNESKVAVEKHKPVEDEKVPASKTHVKVLLKDDLITNQSIDVIDDQITTSEQNLVWMVWKQLMAGGLGGLVSRTTTAPLDRIKILLQASAGIGKERIPIYGVLKCTIKEGGLRSLWRGNFINCMKVGPESAIRLLTFEQMKLLIGQGESDLEMYQRFVAGSIAGIIAQTSIYPMEVIRTRMAVAKTGVYKNFYDCTKKLKREIGWRGFYKGIIPSLIGIVPNAGIDLCIYETMKQNWLNSFAVKPQRPSFTSTLLAGGMSSLCSMAVCYPFALIRTNLQAETIKPELKGSNEFITMSNSFRDIVKTHGIRGLYRGIVPNMLKVVPACSISYMVYEQARDQLGLHS